MKAKLPLIARILLGLVFTFAGIAGLVGIIQHSPQPEGLPEAMVTFNTGLAATVYFMPFLKIVETLCGLCLLVGWFVPLALVILAPVLLNIFFVNAFMMPMMIPIPLVMGLLMIYLAFFSPYSPKIKALFHKK